MISQPVFTGGPATGKTSVMEEFAKKGFPIIHEVARPMLKFFRDHEPHKLPQNNNVFFQAFVESQMLLDFVSNPMGLFDRGLPDQVAYRWHFKLPVPDTLIDACKVHRYTRVYYFPLWEEIYVQDDERRESLEEAERLDQLIYSAYCEMGYEPVVVPKVSVEERVEFIFSDYIKNKWNQ